MLDAAPGTGQIEEAVARAMGRSVALLHFNGVMSYDPDAVGAGPELVALANAIVDAGACLTVVSLGFPHALSLFPRAHTRLCSYSTCSASVRAVIRVLAGSSACAGPPSGSSGRTAGRGTERPSCRLDRTSVYLSVSTGLHRPRAAVMVLPGKNALLLTETERDRKVGTKRERFQRLYGRGIHGGLLRR